MVISSKIVNNAARVMTLPVLFTPHWQPTRKYNPACPCGRVKCPRSNKLPQGAVLYLQAAPLLLQNKSYLNKVSSKRVFLASSECRCMLYLRSLTTAMDQGGRTTFSSAECSARCQTTNGAPKPRRPNATHFRQP
jgi:hypothetical protein